MKNQNTMFAASLAGAILFSGVVHAQSGTRDTAILELYGERGWTVSCEMRQSDGDVINSRERGRGIRDTGRIVVSDVVGGTCDFDVPANGALMISLRTAHTPFECPFAVNANGDCQAAFRPGVDGRFQIRRASGADAQTGS